MFDGCIAGGKSPRGEREIKRRAQYKSSLRVSVDLARMRLRSGEVGRGSFCFYEGGGACGEIIFENYEAAVRGDSLLGFPC